MRVTRDQCKGRSAGGGHHFYGCWFHQYSSIHNVDVLPGLCEQDDLIAGGEPVQIAEQLSIDIVMRREHHLSIIARIGGANILADSLLKLFPTISLHDRSVHTYCPDFNSYPLIRARDV